MVNILRSTQIRLIVLCHGFIFNNISDSSFSENFYGLKRISLNHDSLTKKHKELSLIFLVAIPYFKRKLDEKIAIIRIENAEGSIQKVSQLVNFL